MLKTLTAAQTYFFEKHIGLHLVYVAGAYVGCADKSLAFTTSSISRKMRPMSHDSSYF